MNGWVLLQIKLPWMQSCISELMYTCKHVRRIPANSNSEFSAKQNWIKMGVCVCVFVFVHASVSLRFVSFQKDNQIKPTESNSSNAKLISSSSASPMPFSVAQCHCIRHQFNVQCWSISWFLPCICSHGAVPLFQRFTRADVLYCAVMQGCGIRSSFFVENTASFLLETSINRIFWRFYIIEIAWRSSHQPKKHWHTSNSDVSISWVRACKA